MKLLQPLEAALEPADTSDSTSLSSTSVSCIIPIAPIPATTHLPSALKGRNNNKTKVRQSWRNWKLGGAGVRNKKRRVHFASATTIILPPPPFGQDVEVDGPLSDRDRRHQTWYNAWEIQKFQGDLDRLQNELDDATNTRGEAASWACQYRKIYETAYNHHPLDSNKHDDSFVVSVALALDCLAPSSVCSTFLLSSAPTTPCIALLGAERLVVRDDILAQRAQHRRAVLDAQANVPYNNVNRRERAIREASLQESGSSQRWARAVAEMAHRYM